jgi:HlyD family secretion protein
MRELQAPVAEQAQLQAQATLDNAQAQWQRSQALFQKGFIGEAALQEARKALTLAEAQSRTAQKQLESLASKGSDFALAEQAVAQAQANAQAAHARSQYTVVRAASDGQLIARNVEVGDVVQPGKVLMSLSPAGAVQLVINIDEKNLRLLALRQPALASADAYPQERFAATVAYINPGVNAQTGAVEVKLDVPQPPAHLQQDMTVSVDVEVARRPQALVLATHALHDAESPAPWVLVAQDNQAVRRNPRLGLRSGGWAEVLGGLNEGDAVLPAQAGVAEGARLRPLVRPAVAASAAAPAQDNR